MQYVQKSVLAIGCLFLLVAVARPQRVSDCDRMPAAQAFEHESAVRKAELVKLNGRGTDAKLRARLLAMREADQQIRKKLFGSTASNPALLRQMSVLDARLTRELEAIVAAHGWPTINLVGLEASQAAALILIHSPDHSFQRRLIPELERLVKQKRIVGEDVATLIDKLLVAEGRPQRFGTQFSWKGNGPMSMDPVEDPSGLEQRRKEFLLPPLPVYECYMKAAYHRDIR